MRKIRLFSIVTLIFLFSIFIVSCSGKKKSKDDSSNTVQTQQNYSYYDVEFKNYNGDLLYETSVKEGEKAEYIGDTPIRPDEADCYYTFDGWSPSADEAVFKKTIYVAKFVRHDCVNYTIKFKDDNGNILHEGYVRENTMPTYPKGTPTKPNDDNYSYTFKEWNPKLVVATSAAEYSAVYESHELPYKINVDLDGGSSVTLNKTTFKTDKLTSDMLVFDVNKSGFAFRGYELNGTKIFDEYGQEVSNIALSKNEDNVIKAIYDDQVKLTIKYTLYNPLTNKLIEESISKPYYAEDVSETGNHICNTTVDLYAEAADDYSFAGWYYNGKALSNYKEYNYMMWEKDLTIEARFIVNPYKLSIQSNKFDLGGVEILDSEESSSQAFDGSMYMAGDTTTVFAYTKGETRFLGWYELIDDEEIFVSPNAVYSFVMPKKDYTLEARWELTTLTTKSNNTYGTLSSNSVYDKKELEEGTKVSLSCSVKSGYIFDGWYDGKTLVSSSTSFTYTMPKRAVTLVATFRGITVTLVNDANVQTSFVSGIVYKTGESITINATNNTGKKLIWYNNNIASNYGNSYTFKTSTSDITIKVIASDSFESIAYTKENNKIYFGSYPQTKVEATNDNGLSSITYDSTWTSYGYYISSSNTADCMYYKDVDTDNDGIYDYRGVYISNFRPYIYSGTTYTYQDDNGFKTSKIYWFSYDPVEWIILEQKNGKAFLVANLVLDSQDYYTNLSGQATSTFSHNGGTGYANNYELSYIRKWLNENFYNVAFNGLQQALIDKTIVSNAASTTSNSTNPYACNNTEDKMFLLSYGEAWNYFNSNAARQAKATDYAKCQGVSVSTTSGYLGNSFWMLRSPFSSSAIQSSVVTTYGYETNVNVSYNCYGVRPACWITL